MVSSQETKPKPAREIEEITPAEAQRRCQSAPRTMILDVREAHERATAQIPGSQHLPSGEVGARIEVLVPDQTTPIICHCWTGIRSLQAARLLRSLGYGNVVSLAGGLQAWQAAGLPCATALSVFTPEERERYGRHLAIPEVGERGQERLRAAKVVVVGAGGLGSPAALYLAAAGVGTIGIIDADRVELSNLQRQILHTTARVGRPKVESARQTLLELNPLVVVHSHNTRLTAENATELLAPYDVILDGSDNFPTRYLINDTSVRLGTPQVHGSVYRFEGQVAVFWPGRGPCYRCLYPEAPPAELCPSCAEAGVLGILPGVIGMLQAVEAIKLILQIGDPLVGRLICYDALRTSFRELQIPRDPRCGCASGC